MRVKQVQFLIRNDEGRYIGRRRPWVRWRWQAKRFETWAEAEAAWRFGDTIMIAEMRR